MNRDSIKERICTKCKKLYEYPMTRYRPYWFGWEGDSEVPNHIDNFLLCKNCEKKLKNFLYGKNDWRKNSYLIDVILLKFLRKNPMVSRKKK